MKRKNKQRQALTVTKNRRLVIELFSTVEAQSSFYCCNSQVKTISDAYVQRGSQSAIPALSMGMQWFEGLLRRIPPEAGHAVFGIPAGCYSVGRKKKSAILLPSAGGKINTTFPSGLRPLAILFPCQPLGFCWTLIRLSPGTLMNNKQTAQRFLYYTVQSRWLFTAKNVQPPSQKVGASLEFNHNKVMENGNYI